MHLFLVGPEDTELVASEQLGDESQKHRIADRMASLTPRRPWMLPLRLAAALLRSLFLPHSVLLLENVALRRQLSALNGATKRRRLRQSDRILWASPVLGSQRSVAAEH